MLDLASRPVSATLVTQLEADLRRYDIVIWLDRDAHYTELADALAHPASGFAAPVLGFRGSYLELMLSLEDHAGSIDKSPLLIHLPGATEDSVKASPLLEVYSAGVRFRRGLETLIKQAAVGRVPLEEVEALLASEAEGEEPLDLARADAWMARRVRSASGELAAMLGGLDAPGLAQALFDDGGPLMRQLAHSGAYGELWHRLGAVLGLPESWEFPRPRAKLVEPERRVQDGERDLGGPVRRGIRDAMASWAMCVEYVHDLGRETRAPALEGLRDSLSAELRVACEDVASFVRAHYPKDYAPIALDLEGFIERELKAGSAADLGKIDTFRFEERQLYKGALSALEAGDWGPAGQWARDRLEGRSFWVQRQPERKNAWTLIGAAASLGAALASSSLSFEGARSHAEAVSRYVEHGASIDRLHRELGQRRVELLYDKVPDFARLRAVIEATRKAYLKWQDARAREWAQLCVEEGPLPGAELRQRQIFDDVVAPMLEDGHKTALFMVDAMRFEMAGEFLELLSKTDRKVAKLRPYLAELPTMTEIGMNALAPVVQGGKLRVQVKDKGKAKAQRFKGFSTGEFVVHDPKTRRRAVAGRTRGRTCPGLSLEALLRKDLQKLGSIIAEAQLVVVHSENIDAAGEKGVGLSVFSGELLRLRKAWQLLRDAGVTRFVITSDHGFLLRVPGDAELDSGHDNARARYALNSGPSNSSEHYSVPLRALDYEGEDGYLVFPRGGEVFAGGKHRNFVHGGNSPQERVIPVLTLRHKTPPGGSDRRYQLRLSRDYGAMAGMHYLEAELERELASGFDWDNPEAVDLGIRVVDDSRVQAHVNHGGDGAEMEAGLWRVPIGRRFRLYFRLTGPRGARVRVELVHPSGTEQIEIEGIPRRFEVTEVVETRREPGPKVEAKTDASREPPAQAADEPSGSGSGWAKGLEVYKDADARKIFEHLAKHGSINEDEALNLLGSTRKCRRFARNFDAHAALAPFVVSIESINGSKRYVKHSDKDQ